VVEVGDLGGFGEFGGGDAPDPGGAVADDRELPDVVRAAADALSLDQVCEHGGGLEGGDDARGLPVADREAVGAEIVLGEEDGGLDLAGAGPAVLTLALAACGFPAGHGDAGSVDGGIELVRERRGRQRHEPAGGDQCGTRPAGESVRNSV